ncbi:MAG TPA: tripartite tricarboxylate transporter substrate binding protein [Casimicrobiaceae bacterium]|nr:tripartite tricarboxylate transporter substrate binding protein [Casimicrobiaceae bacterium]
MPLSIARQVSALAFALAALASPSPVFAADDWSPTKPVHIIVPLPGSTVDALARIVQPELSKALGQPVIVEDKGGAGGNIGADYVAKSAPDGQTLLVGFNGPLVVNQNLFSKLPYDPVKDLVPITLAVTSPQFLVVNPSVPVKNVAEFVALAKAEPGRLSYASVSVGSASHLTMEMLKSAAHVDVVHVPYKGSQPAVVDILGGQVQAGFFVPGNVMQFMQQGKLRAIASTGPKRFPLTPDVPTMIEQGFPDFVALSWIGFLAPAGTPRPIIDRYNREIVRIVQSPEVRAKLENMQFEIVAGSPEQFAQWMQAEIPRWGKVIKETGAKAD